MTTTTCSERPATKLHDAVIAVLRERRARRFREPADPRREPSLTRPSSGVSLLERLAYASLAPKVRIIRLACGYRRTRGFRPISKPGVRTFVRDRVLPNEAVELTRGVYAEALRQELVVDGRRPKPARTGWRLMPLDERRRAVVETVFGIHFERPNALAVRIPRPGIVTALVSYWDTDRSRFRTEFLCRSAGLTVRRHVDDLGREEVLGLLTHGPRGE